MVKPTAGPAPKQALEAMLATNKALVNKLLLAADELDAAAAEHDRLRLELNAALDQLETFLDRPVEATAASLPAKARKVPLFAAPSARTEGVRKAEGIAVPFAVEPGYVQVRPPSGNAKGHMQQEGGDGIPFLPQREKSPQLPLPNQKLSPLPPTFYQKNHRPVVILAAENSKHRQLNVAGEEQAAPIERDDRDTGAHIRDVQAAAGHDAEVPPEIQQQEERQPLKDEPGHDLDKVDERPEQDEGQVDDEKSPQLPEDDDANAPAPASAEERN